MRKQFTIILVLIFVFLSFPSFHNLNAATNSLAKKLSGKIILQVESRGEAYYINPADLRLYYLGKPEDAFRVIRSLGLGISNKDFDSFNGKAPSRLSGRILLKVEDSGKAYYINPTDLTLNFLGKPADAYNLMRKVGVGVSNKDSDLLMNNQSTQAIKNIKSQALSSNSPDIKEKIQYIVQIVCPIQGGTMSGTGIMIYGNSAADNKVITNKHVLNGTVGPCGIYRTLNYENQPTLYYKSSSTFIFSKNYDLAIITPDVSNLTIYPSTNIEFSQSSDLLNKNIYVLGYPVSAGNNITLTKGIISGTENINNLIMYKTDAKIDSGNSGGAVFDENGKLIGVPTLASQGNFSSYGYIIPVSVVKSFLDIVDQEGYGKQNWQYPEFNLYGVNPSNTVPEPPSSTTQNPAPQQQDNSALKIAKCQAEKEQQRIAFKAALEQMIQENYNQKPSVQDIVDNFKKQVGAQGVLDPATVGALIEQETRRRLQTAESTYKQGLKQGDVILQNDYIKCLSK